MPESVATPPPGGLDMFLLRHTLDEHPDAQAVVDDALCFVYANKAYLAGWGLAGQDIVGRPVASVVNRELYEATVRESLKGCLDGREARYGTWVDYPGGRRYKLVKYTPLSPDGKRRYVLASIVDITEKKQVEDTARRQQERLKSILDALGFGVMIVDDTHRVRFVNAFVEREFGPPGDVPCHAYLQGRDTPCPWCRNLEVFSGRAVSWEWESPVSARTYERCEAAIPGDGGGPAKLLVFRDITPLLDLEKRLRDMEGKFQTLVHEAPVAIFIQTRGNFAFMNKAAVDLFGGNAASDFLGKPVADRFHPDFVDKVRERIRRLNLDRQAVPVATHRALRPDGSTVDVDVLATPFAWEGEDGALVFARDVTERRRHERDLLKAKEAAESASRSKSEFLANMSHEIRTPLNGVMGMLQLMQTTSLDGEQTEYVDTALESSRKLLVILNDVLDLSRVESGRVELRLAPVDLFALCRSVVGMFMPQALEKGIGLELDVDPQTPGTCVFDETRLRQVLFNLVGNAVKFTDAGGVTLRLRPAGIPGGTGVSFCVEDTGIGIPREQHAYIFENFTQADGCLTRRHGGVGLGLAIVRRLVALMGGEVGLESEPGRGARFFFTLPIGAGESGEAKSRPGPAQTNGSRTRTVLVVEDDPQNLIFLQRSLEKLGYAVVTAQDGRQAVLAADRPGLDCILMDIQMPVMDGLEAIRIIRSGSGPSAARPIVALTAHAMVGDRERCLAAGADDYLTKPVEVLRLHAAIQRLMTARSGNGSRPGRSKAPA